MFRDESKANSNIAKVNADGTYTFTDKNNQLGNYDVNITNGSVISHTDSQLKVKIDANKKAKITLVQNKANAENERSGVLVLLRSGLQTMTKAKADPRQYYAFVTGLDTGNLSLVKTSDDGVVDGLQFKITGPNGFTTQVTTKNGGKIEIPNLEQAECQNRNGYCGTDRVRQLQKFPEKRSGSSSQVLGGQQHQQYYLYS